MLDLFVKLPVSEPDQAKQLFAAAWKDQPGWHSASCSTHGISVADRAVIDLPDCPRISHLASPDSSNVYFRLLRSMAVTTTYCAWKALQCGTLSSTTSSVSLRLTWTLSLLESRCVSCEVAPLGQYLSRYAQGGSCHLLVPRLDGQNTRKSIVPLRTHLRIVEQAMCANQWDTIDFGAIEGDAPIPRLVPSTRRRALPGNTWMRCLVESRRLTRLRSIPTSSSLRTWRTCGLLSPLLRRMTPFSTSSVESPELHGRQAL